MTEQKIDRIPARSEKYAKVMAEAMSRALTRAKAKKEEPLLTLSDLFEAVCVVDPDAFGYLLGRKVSLPKVNPVKSVKRPAVICHSSEVDRYLSPYGGVISQMFESIAVAEVELGSMHIAAALIWDPIPQVMDILAVCGVPPDLTKTRIRARLRRDAERNAAEKRKRSLAETFENVAKIRDFLMSRCFGQDEAINAIVTQLSIAWGMPPADRGAKPLSFFFVGAPGTGKNHLTSLLQEAFENILGIPVLPTVDFARYATEQMPIDLIGRDSVWKDGGHEGVLTGMATDNPRGIIVIENYERGHDCAVSYLDSILETGFTVDEFTKKNVCFSNNVFVVITHKKEFAESDEFLALVSKGGKNPPRDKIIEGLVKFEPKFQSTLRLIDTPVLFRKHTFRSFFAIVKERLAAMAHRFSDAYDAVCEFESEDVLRLLLEMHPNVMSAHPIVSALESSVLMPLQDWLLNHYGDFAARRKFRIVCAPLPDFEGAPARGDFKTFDEWMAARTTRRVLQAKRLVFNQRIELAPDAVVLRFTDISYAVLPSIEDSEYFSVTVPDVSFSDLVGVGLVRERVAEVLDYFNHPDKGRVKPDTGIILYGPPGTGKTSVAKAIAKELGVPFIMAMGADFRKPHLGEGVESVKRLFAAARRYGAVIFIDEIDGIGSRDKGFGEDSRIINAFLTELDGFRERNLLVIGATNRYEALDEALVRPGRLSLKIQLGLLHRPEDRRQLIEEALAKVEAKIGKRLIDRLVETTNAWSPANLVAMVNRGVSFARHAGEAIAFKHFALARTVVMFGEDPQRQDNAEKENHQIAVHEAGHAVMAVLRGIPFVQVTIQGVGATAGFVEHLGLQGFCTAKELERMLDMSLGGRAAEEILAEPSDGVEKDFEHATSLASRMIRLGLAKGNIMSVAGETDKEFTLRHRKEIEDILQERMRCVQKLLLEHRAFLIAVSDALETQKLLFEADVLTISAASEGGKP
jgi:ATP-dependent Zn protease